jgi:hypothetical protein
MNARDMLAHPARPAHMQQLPDAVISNRDAQL